MCVYMYIYMYMASVYVYMYICIYVYIYICIYVYMYICIYVYMYNNMCIYVYIYLFFYMAHDRSAVHILCLQTVRSPHKRLKKGHFLGPKFWPRFFSPLLFVLRK